MRGARGPAGLAVLTILTVSLALGGCVRGDISQREIVATGSTTVLPIAEVAAEEFAARHPGKRVLVMGVGSTEGIERVAKGTCEIGTSSRDLKDEEKAYGLVDTPIAFDGIAVIVNPANPVDGLTKAQVAAIFRGEITNWAQVGGPDEEIGLVNRDEASGTREAFWKIVLDKKPFDRSAAALPGTGQVRSVVAHTESAVGYISMGFADKTVKMLAVDGVRPTERTVMSKTYPISRVLHFFTKGKPTGLTAQYIAFVLSDEVQEGVVRDAGFVPVKKGLDK